MTDVCIISMPYVRLDTPSIGIGQLVASAKGQGIDARAVYANLWFAEKINFISYNLLTHGFNPASLLAEWTFSQAAFPGFTPGDEQYLDLALSAVYHPQEQFGLALRRLGCYKNLSHFMQAMRQQASAFINEAAAKVLLQKPKIVGCSSTFQQHCSSLALLRKLKELDPGLVTVMGGANCEGIMGQTTLKNFPWLDFVVSGEADLIFPTFCRQILERGSVATQQADFPHGVISRQSLDQAGELDATAPVAMVEHLDSVPVPDYDDYFEQTQAYPEKEKLELSLMMETARGCWWGQKRKCSFCGLNGQNVLFRVKSTARVLNEIDTLSRQYQLHRFFVSDNIMDMRHFKELLPRLAENKPVQNAFFFETKANLNEEQVILLRKAGVVRIQPGIESLCDRALKLMHKGVSAATNVSLLKYALENGVNVAWNYLMALPGEDDSWYIEIARWLPLIYHLQPPIWATKIRFDRYSEYHQHQDRYRLKLSPYKTYSYIYPLPQGELENMAYFFEDYSREDQDVSPGVKCIQDCIIDWYKAYYTDIDQEDPDANGLMMQKRDDRPQLMMYEQQDMTMITDTRSCAAQNVYFLTGLEHQLHQFCRRPRSTDNLLENLNRHYGTKLTGKDVGAALNQLVAWQLVLILGGKAFSLATRETVYNKNMAKQQLPIFNLFKGV